MHFMDILNYGASLVQQSVNFILQLATLDIPKIRDKKYFVLKTLLLLAQMAIIPLRLPQSNSVLKISAERTLNKCQNSGLRLPQSTSKNT